MNDNLKKSVDAAKALIEACKKDPKLAEELVKSLEKTQGVPKGVSKDKMESCVQDVDKKGGAKNKYAVCAASLQGKTKKIEKNEFDAMVKADDAKFAKLRKDPPSEGTGLPKPELPHESPKDLKAKRFGKSEIREMMKADDKMLEKAKIIAGPGHAKPKGSVLADLPSPDVGKRPNVSGKNPDMANIRAQSGKPKLPKPGLPPAVNKEEKNPDQAADAKLGEKVEHDVEQHMQENAAAERKEGHKMVAKAALKPGKY